MRPNRRDGKGEHPVSHLSGYKGWVHADGYSGFNGLFGESKASEMACMAHIRRKFVDVQQSQGSAIAEEAIKRIAKLYAVEKLARGKPPVERVALRQKHAKPIFDDLKDWLQAQLPKISGKSPLAQAIRYALGRLPKARPSLENGVLNPWRAVHDLSGPLRKEERTFTQAAAKSTTAMTGSRTELNFRKGTEHLAFLKGHLSSDDFLY